MASLKQPEFSVKLPGQEAVDAVNEALVNRMDSIECAVLALDCLMTVLTRKGVLSQTELSKLRQIIDGGDDEVVKAALDAAGGKP